jgi:DNA polymerase II small subunit
MNERKQLVDFFQKRGLLIHPDAVDLLVQQGKGPADCAALLRDLRDSPFVVSTDAVRAFCEKNTVRPTTHPTVPKPQQAPEVVRKQGASPVTIKRDITGNSTCEGNLRDFVALFTRRYQVMNAMIKRRQEMRHATPIRKAMLKHDDDVAVIGIVANITPAKNGTVLELEDDSGSCTIFIPKDIDDTMVYDEVVGVAGKKRGDLVVASNLVRPEIPRERCVARAPEDAYAVFISDTHVGSKSFLEKEWERFLEWLAGGRGDDHLRDVARKTRYLVISGDIVEGIGIYPNQEEDLNITDVYEQYETLARKLSAVPPHIKIILQPGNHDAVRPSLPQPTFDEPVRDLFADFDATFIGNPCYLELDGVSVLAYHGQSIQDFATHIPNMSQNQPTKIMKEMLKRRHMAPIYGGIASLAPEKDDYLIIEKIPEIFVTGHVHVTAVENYRNVLLINASAWQAQTEYQRMMDFTPDPAKAVAVNLHTLQPAVMRFS